MTTFVSSLPTFESSSKQILPSQTTHSISVVTPSVSMKEGLPESTPSMSLVSLMSGVGSTPAFGSKRTASQAGMQLTGNFECQQPKKTRRRWKKPKGKPKRPLSAYNLYFKAERERMLRDKRHSKLGFRDMAKIVAKKWNDLPTKDRVVYEAPAKEERSKYFIQLAEWKKKQQQKEVDEAFDLQMETLYDAFSSSTDAGDNNDDPLPIEEKKRAVTVSCDLPDNTVDDEHVHKQSGFLADSLQTASELSDDTLKLAQESLDKSEVDQNDKLLETALPEPVLSDNLSFTDPTMQRILKSCDALSSSVDDDFFTFMSSLDWSASPIGL